MMESEVMGNYHASFGERDRETHPMQVRKVRPVPTPLSPVPSNAYVHYVLDLWFAKVVRAHCRGEALLCRFADDWVCAFRYQEDAERFYRVLPKR